MIMEESPPYPLQYTMLVLPKVSVLDGSLQGEIAPRFRLESSIYFRVETGSNRFLKKNYKYEQPYHACTTRGKK